VKYTSIPLIDYIDIEEEQCDVHIHTKDKRVLVFKDVRSNADITEEGLFLEYSFFGQRMNVFVARDDFSHMEYRYSQREGVPRESITKKDFDDLNSFIEEQFWEYKDPSNTLTEPENSLFDDLI
jgi:hypothetical protein